jgi:excinuclease ABC subunit A
MRLQSVEARQVQFQRTRGRCEHCEGMGANSDRKALLPTVFVECDVCHGRRFDVKRSKWSITARSIYEVQKNDVEEAANSLAIFPGSKRSLITR